jgi:hypothetical protein
MMDGAYREIIGKGLVVFGLICLLSAYLGGKWKLRGPWPDCTFGFGGEEEDEDPRVRAIGRLLSVIVGLGFLVFGLLLWLTRWESVMFGGA